MPRHTKRAPTAESLLRDQISGQSLSRNRNEAMCYAWRHEYLVLGIEHLLILLIVLLLLCIQHTFSILISWYSSNDLETKETGHKTTNSILVCTSTRYCIVPRTRYIQAVIEPMMCKFSVFLPSNRARKQACKSGDPPTQYKGSAWGAVEGLLRD